MSLTGKQKHFLRRLAHGRHPNVTVGAGGLNDAVFREITYALNHQELLKIKLPAAERVERKHLAELICARTRAQMVQLLGRTCVVYRAFSEPGIKFPV